MDDSLENNTNQKDRVIKHFATNKKYYLFLIIGIIVTIFIFLSLKIYNENKNNIIANKYIEASLHLNLQNKKKSRDIYEEIIFSKNKFYSILSLNKILEENLEKNKDKILSYFNILENIKLSNSQKDLIYFRKALYLIETSSKKEGYKLLEEIRDSNSSLKSIAEEILNN